MKRPERSIMDRAIIRFFKTKCAEGPEEFQRWAIDTMFRSPNPDDLPATFRRLFGDRIGNDFLKLFPAILAEAV